MAIYYVPVTEMHMGAFLIEAKDYDEAARAAEALYFDGEHATQIDYGWNVDIGNIREANARDFERIAPVHNAKEVLRST